MLNGSKGLAIELAVWFYNVAMGLRGPRLASVTAGTRGKPITWPMVEINRNLTSRLGQVTPGKSMLGQVGNEHLLFWP